ncbi:MAG: hypothetical protein RTV31_02545 [Candidatus Thorarchaeota archaeon]
MIPKSIRYFEDIYGKATISAIMTSCDGNKTMEIIAEETKIPLETLVYVAEKLVLEGLLEIQH